MKLQEVKKLSVQVLSLQNLSDLASIPKKTDIVAVRDLKPEEAEKFGRQIQAIRRKVESDGKSLPFLIVLILEQQEEEPMEAYYRALNFFDQLGISYLIANPAQTETVEDISETINKKLEAARIWRSGSQQQRKEFMEEHFAGLKKRL